MECGNKEKNETRISRIGTNSDGEWKLMIGHEKAQKGAKSERSFLPRITQIGETSPVPAPTPLSCGEGEGKRQQGFAGLLVVNFVRDFAGQTF